MAGVTLMSQFGTQQVDNDPYYGAFVNWGHGIGPRSLGASRKRTKQYRFEEKAFQMNLSKAVKLATDGLQRAILDAWNGRQQSGGGE